MLLDLGKANARARAAELLEWFDLTDAADRPAKTYSGGMRRRLDLAASLVGRPDVIFLDEPTTGLDPSKREDMWDVVRALVTDGSTVLLTTQYLEEADALADEITVIDHGRVIAHDTPDGLKRIVGGQTLEVRPSDLTRLEETATILAQVSSDGRADEIRKGVLAVPVADDSAMTATVSRLASVGIGVTELSLHLPSLDEVFFTLTGRTASEDDTTVTERRRWRDDHDNHSAAPSRRARRRRRSPSRSGPFPLVRHSLAAGQAQPDQDVAHARGAHRRHAAAGDLPGDLRLHLRRRGRR